MQRYLSCPALLGGHRHHVRYTPTLQSLLSCPHVAASYVTSPRGAVWLLRLRLLPPLSYPTPHPTELLIATAMPAAAATYSAATAMPAAATIMLQLVGMDLLRLGLLEQQAERPVVVQARQEELEDGGDEDDIPGGAVPGRLLPPLHVQRVDEVGVP